MYNLFELLKFEPYDLRNVDSIWKACNAFMQFVQFIKKQHCKLKKKNKLSIDVNKLFIAQRQMAYHVSVIDTVLDNLQVSVYKQNQSLTEELETHIQELKKLVGQTHKNMLMDIDCML